MIDSLRQAMFGEFEDFLSAYAGLQADDTESEAGPALAAWLRRTHRVRPRAIATVAWQIRELLVAADSNSGIDEALRSRLPDLGFATEADFCAWLAVVARQLEAVVAAPSWAPPSVPPQTHWEWRARFPELAQLLGGWFSQDAPEEFADHSAALADYTSTTHPDLLAQLTGELHELLALGLNDAELSVAIVELGQEVEFPPALGPGAWLTWLAEGFRAAAIDRMRRAQETQTAQGTYSPDL